MSDTADFNETAGTVLRVDCENLGWLSIVPQEESVVRKAVRDFREKGINCLLELEERGGFTMNIVASEIIGFRLSTPASRRDAILEEIRQDEWEERFRKENAAKPWDATP